MVTNRKANVLAWDEKPFAYATRNDSTAYNEVVDSLKISVLRALNRARSTVDKVSVLNSALMAENTLLASKVRELNMPKTYTSNMAIVTGYDIPTAPTQTNPQLNINWERICGQVTCGYDANSKYSKIVRITDSEGKKVASMDTYITLDGVNMGRSNSIFNMLDDQRDTFWLKTDAVVGQQYTINITFPTSIKSSVNYLALNPFPAFCFDINSITVYKTDGSSVNVAPQGLQASVMSNMVCHFKPTSWNNVIQIVLTAKSETIGISDIDIAYVDYYNSEASVMYQIPAFYSQAFTVINRVNLFDFGLWGDYLLAPGTYDKLREVTVTCYSSDADPNPTVIPYETLVEGDSSPTLGMKTTTLNTAKIAQDNFYIKVSFRPHLGQSPTLRGLKVWHP